MKKLLVAGIAAAAFYGAPALAADLPMKAPARAYVAPAPVFTWNGCYVGGNTGGGWAGGADWTVGGVSGSNSTGSGWVGGLQGGCDVQYGTWVLGFETMWDWGNMKTSHQDPFFALGVTDTNTVQWFGTLTGRVGYAVDRSLLYIKGGVAWAEASAKITDPTGVESVQGSNSRTGWDLGGGWEYAFAPNWSAKIEYNYIGFGSNSFTAPGGFPVTISNQNIQTVLVGLNYRFGDMGKSPVSARY